MTVQTKIINEVMLMTLKRRYSLAAMIFILLELSYFGAIGSIKSAFSISLSNSLVQAVGVLIAVVYILIVDNWIRDYQRYLSLKLALIESTQAKLKRKVDRMEEDIRKLQNDKQQ